MEGERFKRTLGGSLVVLGVILLLFACFAFLSDGTMAGLDVSGWRKAAPALLGLIFMLSGVSIINRT